MHTAVVMWVVALATVAQAKNARTVVKKDLEEKVPTIRGTLELQRVEFEDGDHAFQLALEGKTVAEETEYHVVAIAGRHPEPGPARVVLLELTTGGSGCPMLYKVFEVKDNGKTVRSEEFGNCAMAKSSFKDGVLHIDLPKSRGAAAESWRYQNGKLSKARPPSTRKK